MSTNDVAERCFKGGGSLKSDVTFKGGCRKVTLGDKGGVKNLKIEVTSFMDGPLQKTSKKI